MQNLMIYVLREI